jgi:hypothetical protein
MRTWTRLGGAAGIAFVSLTILGGIVQGDVPVYSEGSTAIKQWFAENNGRYLIGGYCVILGLVFYLAFLATLVAVLSRAEGPARPLSWLALLGGVHLLVAVQASVAFDGTLALLKGDVSDDLARTFSAADYMTFIATYFFAGVLTLATSLVILRARLFWPPLAWLGGLITIGGMVSSTAPLQHDAEGTLTYVGYATLLAFLVWTAGISIALLRIPEIKQEYGSGGEGVSVLP